MSGGGTTSTVALLHYSGPPSVGGVEKTIAAQADWLHQRGLRARIVSGRAGPLAVGSEACTDPLFGSREPSVEAVNRELNAGVVSPRFHRLVDAIRPRLQRALEGTGVVIAHNVVSLHKNLALTAALHQLHGAGQLPPMLAWCHDFAATDATYAGDLHDGYPWSLVRRPWEGARYVAVSGERQGRLAELLGLPAEAIAVVPAGIDLAAFLKLEPETVALAERLALVSADPLLLLPARITRRKRIERAIDITAGLRRVGMDPRLLVSGPPGPHNPANDSYLAALRHQAVDRGVRREVVFLCDEVAPAEPGPATASDAVMADLFRLADGLLLTSAAEGFGIPLLEAGLSGLPIFCSDLPVFREVAPEVAVYFGPDEPADSVAGRIVEVLRRDQRYQLKRRVRQHHLWATVCDQHLLPMLPAAVGRAARSPQPAGKRASGR